MSNKSKNQLFTVRAHWDVETHPSFDGTDLATGSYSPNDGAIWLPEGAIITDAFFNISKTFKDTDGVDNATLELGLTGATAVIRAQSAISNGTDWDAKTSEGTTVMEATLIAPSTTLSEATPNTRTQAVAGTDRMQEMIHIIAPKELLLTVGTDTIDEGTITLWVSYVLSAQIA